MLDKIIQMKASMEQYQEIMNLMPFMESMMSEKENDGSSDGMDTMLKSFLSEDQLAMFNMFQGFNGENNE